MTTGEPTSDEYFIIIKKQFIAVMKIFSTLSHCPQALWRGIFDAVPWWSYSHKSMKRDRETQKTITTTAIAPQPQMYRIATDISLLETYWPSKLAQECNYKLSPSQACWDNETSKCFIVLKYNWMPNIGEHLRVLSLEIKKKTSLENLFPPLECKWPYSEPAMCVSGTHIDSRFSPDPTSHKGEELERRALRAPLRTSKADSGIINRCLPFGFYLCHMHIVHHY